MAESRYPVISEITAMQLSKTNVNIDTYAVRASLMSVLVPDLPVPERAARLEKWWKALPIVLGTEYRYHTGADGSSINIIAPFDVHVIAKKTAAAAAKAITAGFLDMWLPNGRTKGKGAYSVTGSYVAPKHQGKRLMLHLYHTLITKRGMMLQSDTSQSAGGIKLWRELSRLPDVFMYAWDARGKKAYHIFDGDDDTDLDTEAGDVYGIAYEHLHAELDRLHTKRRQLKGQRHTSTGARAKVAQELRDVDRAIEDVQQEMEGLLNSNLVLVATKGKRPAE